MANTAPFDTHAQAYDAWFDLHDKEYAQELAALEDLLHGRRDVLDIGMGSGRFALPLGITTGVEPSAAMRAIAKAKGLAVVEGVAESLPFEDERFDVALLITVLCFVDEPKKALLEALRVVRPGGSVIIGFIDKAMPMGAHYEARKTESRFYASATFFTYNDMEALVHACGASVTQTRRIEAVQDAFVFLEAVKH